MEPAEVKKLLAAVKEDRLSTLYTVALAVGLRQGEALGLRWQDVNLDAGTLTVRGGLQWVDGYPVLNGTQDKPQPPHHQATTADIYSHVLPVLMADAAQRMNEALVSP